MEILKKHINNLNFERLAGTEGEKRAIEYITGVIKEKGYTPELESFDITTMKPTGGKIIAGNRVYDARPYGGFAKFEREGILEYVEHHSLIKNPENKIFMLYQRFSQREYKKLNEKNIGGFIFVNAPEREEFSGHISQSLVNHAKVPILTVSYDTALALLKHRGKKIKIRGRGKILKTKATNIKVKGGKNPEILICAHYDTVPYSKGMSDNGGGSVVLLRLLEDGIDENMEIVWFSGEELGLLGSFYHSKSSCSYRLVINVDVTGDDIGRNGIIITGDDSLMKWVKKVLKDNELYAQIRKDIYSSDSLPFAKLGIPGININRGGGLPSFHIHTKKDTAKITGYGLHQTYTILKAILSRIKEEGIPETKGIPEGIKRKIKKYLKDRLHEVQ